MDKIQIRLVYQIWAGNVHTILVNPPRSTKLLAVDDCGFRSPDEMHKLYKNSSKEPTKSYFFLLTDSESLDTIEASLNTSCIFAD